MWAQCRSCQLVQQPAAICAGCGQPLGAPPPPPPPAALPTEPPWYYARDGQTIGPVPFDDLREFARRGTLKPTDHVLQHGTSNWVAAGSLPALFPHQPPPPPPPPPALAPVAPMGEVPCEVVPERERLGPYLPFGARARSDNARWFARAWRTWGLIPLVFLFGMAGLLLLVPSLFDHRPPPGSAGSNPTPRAAALGPLILGTLYLILQRIAIVIMNRRWRQRFDQETACGREWARFQHASEAACKAYLDPSASRGPEHPRQLLDLVPHEPQAVYIGFQKVQSRTWNLETMSRDARPQAAEALTVLLCHKLYALELPRAWLGRTTIDDKLSLVFRVEVDDHIQLEVCFAVQLQGTGLTLFWAANVLTLYPRDIYHIFGTSLQRVLSGPSYGHTSLWTYPAASRLAAEASGDREEIEHCQTMFAEGNPTGMATARTLVQQVEHATEQAQVELGRALQSGPDQAGAARPQPPVRW